MTPRIAFLHAVALYAPLVHQHVQVQEEMEPGPDTFTMGYSQPTMPKTPWSCVKAAMAFTRSSDFTLRDETEMSLSALDAEATGFVERYFGYKEPRDDR